MTTLEECFNGLIPLDQSEFSMSAYVLNGGLNWNLIEAFVPNNLCGKINGVNPPLGTNVKDYPNWNPSSDRTFTLKYASS